MISIGRLRLIAEAAGAAEAEPLGRRFAAALQRELRAAGATQRLRIDELVLEAPGREAAPELWAKQTAMAIVQRAKTAPPPQPSPAAHSSSPPPRAGEGQGGGERRLTATTVASKARHDR